MHAISAQASNKRRHQAADSDYVPRFSIGDNRAEREHHGARKHVACDLHLAIPYVRGGSCTRQLSWGDKLRPDALLQYPGSHSRAATPRFGRSFSLYTLANILG